MRRWLAVLSFRLPCHSRSPSSIRQEGVQVTLGYHSARRLTFKHFASYHIIQLQVLLQKITTESERG